MTHVGLYVHIPFCPSKCGYCDFYSVVPEYDEIDPFIDALLMELQSSLQSANAQIETIFVGGGTPAFLPIGPLERLLAELGRCASEHGVREFTVEANPGSIDATKLACLRDHGVNRISMGAQSFHETELRVLGRIHKPAEIAGSAELIRKAGFEHFNIDLIFGIPGQTPSSWSDSIRQAVALGPDHLACYGLTFEPGTPLHERCLIHGQIVRVGEELETELYLIAIRQLSALGFEQYEISNFARPNGQCQHNLRYWHNQPGLGIGPAGASYLEGKRWRNVADIAEYVRRIQTGKSPIDESEILSPAQRAGESAMLALRLTEGINPEKFQQAAGFDPHELFADAIARHKAADLLTATPNRIALTPQGRLVADTVIADFLMPGV